MRPSSSTVYVGANYENVKIVIVALYPPGATDLDVTVVFSLENGLTEVIFRAADFLLKPLSSYCERETKHSQHQGHTLTLTNEG